MNSKLLSISLILLFGILFCSGISNMYIMRNSHEGKLIHVFEQKMPNEKSDSKIPDIKYDYTYIENQDSVSFLSYITLSQSEIPNSITFQNNEIDYKQDVELIFVRPKGKNFQYRLKIKFPFKIWKSLYEDPIPFKIIYSFNRNGQIVDYNFRYGSKKWDRNRKKILEIINIIIMNKKR